MGGGGFSMSPLGAPTNLDRYLVELTGKSSPMVCFVPTASADDPLYINRFLNAYGTLGVRPIVLTLWEGAADAVRRIQEADLVVVGNGLTVNMMALWEAHGVDKALHRRYSAGDVVMAGVAAGGNAWFEGCVTDSFGDFRPYRNGLGLVSGSFCCHFDKEDGRQGVYTDAVANGVLPGGYAADDHAGVHLVDGKLHKVISEEPGAKVYRIEPSDSPSASGLLVEPMEGELL